jgi:hypothetical protein
MKIDIYELLRELTARGIYFELASVRDDYLMVTVSVPGERWEIEFSKSGTIEIEIYRSNGIMLDESAFEDLFQRFSD